ncbi:MAG TPA: homocysteine S-methyltransferase family protein, partial [Anaerostipes hadrus]|nr:homocysteine S-methyltransferase family protein [Anaerostipes hadrus]
MWTAKILAEQPELIKQVHKNYFKAGADIILFETVPSDPVIISIFFS